MLSNENLNKNLKQNEKYKNKIAIWNSLDSLTLICLNMSFFGFMILDFHLAYCFCRFLSFIKFVCYTVWYYLRDPQGLVLFKCFPPCSSSWIISLALSFQVYLHFFFLPCLFSHQIHLVIFKNFWNCTFQI